MLINLIAQIYNFIFGNLRSYFVLLYINFNPILPSLAKVLKLRYKLVNTEINEHQNNLLVYKPVRIYTIMKRFYTTDNTWKRKDTGENIAYNNILFFSISIISIYFLRSMLITKVVFYLTFLVLFMIAGLVIIYILFVLILDNLYRPNIPQYPFNIYLDRFIPILFLISPTISIIFFSPFAAWFTRLSLLIIIHILVIIPILHYWSKLRNLDLRDDSSGVFMDINFNSWKHPRLYKYISIGILYPLIWGLYFSLTRYIRLGSTIDFYDTFSFLGTDFLTLLIFLLPHIFLWLLIPLYYMSKIRLLLWEYTKTLVNSIHIHFLRYTLYFKMMEKLYKFHHFYFSAISLGNYTNLYLQDTASRFRKLISYLYYYPIWLLVPFYSSILLELVLCKGKLFYGVYILFLFPLILTVFRCINEFGSTLFVVDVCMSDYMQGNWESARYPQRFWFLVENPLFYFGFVFPIYEEIHDKWQPISVAMKFKYKQNNSAYKHKLIHRVWRRTSIIDRKTNNITILVSGVPKKWSIRMAADYRLSGVRWYYTSRVLYMPLGEKILKLHPAVINYCKTPYDYISVIDKIPYNLIEQGAARNIRVWPSTKTLFGEIPQKIYVSEQPKQIIDMQEIATVIKHNSLTEKNIHIGTYPEMKKIYGYPEETNQMRPDLVLHSKDSNIVLKNYLGLDQKTMYTNTEINKSKIPIDGRNQILVGKEEKYNDNLDLYLYALTKKTKGLSLNMEATITLLKRTCQDFNPHLDVWIANVHHFPKNWRPPYRMSNNFDYDMLSPQAKLHVKRAGLKFEKLSEYFYEIKIPETSSLPEESLDLFQYSYIQKILSDDIDYSLTVD